MLSKKTPDPWKSRDFRDGSKAPVSSKAAHFRSSPESRLVDERCVWSVRARSAGDISRANRETSPEPRDEAGGNTSSEPAATW
jgi:hypothetical protein